MSSREHHDDHLGAGAFVGAYLGLLVLTSATFGLSYVALGAWHMAVALIIAGLKAVVVGLIFMHLAAAAATTRMIAAVAVAFVVLLASLTILDADVRARADSPTTPVGGAALAKQRAPARERAERD